MKAQKNETHTAFGFASQKTSALPTEDTYRQIATLEELRQQKRLVHERIAQSASSMKRTLDRAFLPADGSLVHSPVGVVRYASYAITAYKTVRSLHRWVKFLRTKRS